MTIVEMITDRCHVGQSNLGVIRYVVSRMKPGAWEGLDREMRRELMRQAIERHRENRELYHDVRNGLL